MKNIQSTPRKLLVTVLWLSLVLILQGCPSAMRTTAPVHTSNKVGNSEYEIVKTQKSEIRDSILDNVGLDTGSYHSVPMGYAGTKDTHTGDRPHGTPGRDPDYVPEKTGGPYANFPTPKTDKLRAKAARQLAAKNLKLSKKIAKSEKLLENKIADAAELAKRSSGCFPSDALVIMDDGTYKPLSKIQIGDLVMTYDIGYEKTVVRPVIGTYSVKANHLYTINDDLITTGGERVLTQKGWRVVSELEKSDFLLVNNQMEKVTSIEFHRKDMTLYNMQIDDTHNFYIVPHIGTNYLVHNTSGGGK